MKNKKIVVTFFVILSIVVSSNISLARTGIVNTPAVRIREKANTDSEILTRAYEDDEVEIVGEEDDWYKVTVNGKTGYAKKNLIKEKGGSTLSENTVSQNTTNQNTVSNYPVEESEKPKETEKPEQAEGQEQTPETTNSSKNVIKEDTVGRILPNFASNEAILLTKDTEIEIVREINNWSEIFVNNQKVWILTNKISVAAVVPNETQTKPEENKNTVPAENTVSENTNTTNTDNKNENTTNTNTTNTTTSTTADTRNTKGIINVETANIREKADKSSKIVHRLDEGDEVTIVAEEGDWYKIKNDEVENGYVSKSLVKIPNVSSRSMSESRKEVEPVEEEKPNGTAVVDFAKQYLGASYVLGGKTPDGFDCSGYTRYVFKNFGFSLGTVASEQDSVGAEVSRDDLQEGDLILFYNDEKTKIGHTGIYIGNNEFIHAANPERGVVTDNLETNSYYSTRFVTARRIVE